MKRTRAEISLEMTQLTQEYVQHGTTVPEGKVYSLVIESIESEPTMEHKVAALRSFVRGRMNLPVLPEDIALLEIPEHQA